MEYRKMLLVASTSLLLAACSHHTFKIPEAQTQHHQANPSDQIVWAINSGGDAYLSSDGIQYQADAIKMTSGDASHVVIAKGTILGTQDPNLYLSSRQGETIAYQQPLANGTYSVTLRFAEDQWTQEGKRQFSVWIEDQQRIPVIDVVNDRDGRNMTSYDISVPNVELADGQLNIDFKAVTGNASISAIVVRKPYQVDKDWHLVWQDEFNQDGRVDETKWNYELWAPKRVNEELQRYTDRSENVRQQGGNLIIEARRDFFQGDEYSSARITSAGKGDLLYGRVEVRAKLPDGLGTWPAIWMMPSDFDAYAESCEDPTDEQKLCNSWPNSGEIDILEHVGFDEGRIHSTMHNKAFFWKNFKQRKGALYEPDVTHNFHLYAMEWSPERIDVFIDDTLYFSYINDHQGWQSWPFDKPFHVILNIAVGGGWGGIKGVADDIWPKQMLIDYVRLYQKKSLT